MPFAAELNKHGYDTLHVRDLNMQDSHDEEIFQKAFDENRIIVSADTDFGTLLALRNENKPSVILFRKSTTRRPEKQVQILTTHLDKIKNDLKKGSIVVFTEKSIRIRSLPIGKDE